MRWGCDRSLAEEFVTVEQARADCSAALRTDGSVLADLVPDDSTRVRCSAGQRVDDSIQADLVLWRLGSGRLFGWAVGGRFGSGRLFGAGRSGRTALFSGCAAGILGGG